MNFISKFIKKSLTFGFFSDFLMIYAFYNTIFISYNFSKSELSFLLVVMQLSKLIFDIPIGVFVDFYGRRNVFLIGILCRLLFCFILFGSKNYSLILLASFFWGIANSCFFYHVEAYYYDVLKKNNRESLYSRFIGSYYSVQNLSITIATFFSFYVYRYFHFQGILMFSIVVLFFSFYFLFQLPSYKISNNIKIQDKFLFFKKSLYFISKRPSLIRLIFISALLDSLFIFFIDFNTTLANTFGLKPDNISFLVSFVGFVRIFTNYLSGYIVNYLSVKRVKNILLFLSIFVIISSIVSPYLFLFSIALYLCIYSLLDNSIKTKLQQKINSSYRATIMSIGGFVSSILSIFFNSVNGYVSSLHSYRSSILTICCLILIFLSLLRSMSSFYRLSFWLKKVLK